MRQLPGALLPSPCARLTRIQSFLRRALWALLLCVPCIPCLQVTLYAQVQEIFSPSWQSQAGRQGTARMLGSDVRVGTRDKLRAARLAADDSSGTLFAVTVTDDHAGSLLDLYMSKDGGLSWPRINWVSAAYRISCIDAAVAGGYCYVIFSAFNGATVYTFRVRVADGEGVPFANNDSWMTVMAVTRPDTIGEAVLVSDADSGGDTLYCVALTSAHELKCRVAPAADPQSWTPLATDASDASRGLSACFDAVPGRLFVAYIDTADAVTIDTMGSAFHLWTKPMAGRGASGTTSIAVHSDTVLCAFDLANPARRAQYVTRYGSNPVLYSGTIGDTLQRSEAPAVTMGRGTGTSIVYRYAASPGTLRLTSRRYAGPWSFPQEIAQYAPSLTQPAILALGEKKYGVLYLSEQQPAERGAYFTTSVATIDFAEPEEPLPGGFALLQNYPNPFNPSTQIAFELPETATVSLKVYSVLGEEVATLISGRLSAGRHTCTWSAPAQAASGIYLARLQSGTFRGICKLLLLK